MQSAQLCSPFFFSDKIPFKNLNINAIHLLLIQLLINLQKQTYTLLLCLGPLAPWNLLTSP